MIKFENTEVLGWEHAAALGAVGGTGEELEKYI